MALWFTFFYFREWIGTIATWPQEFVYKDMFETGIDLSRRLRDPQGNYRCDLIIALTHSRSVNASSVCCRTEDLATAFRMPNVSSVVMRFDLT